MILAREAYAEATAVLRGLHEQGAPLRSIATELNGPGFYTRIGKSWTHIQVHRIYVVSLRLEAAERARSIKTERFTPYNLQLNSR